MELSISNSDLLTVVRSDVNQTSKCINSALSLWMIYLFSYRYCTVEFASSGTTTDCVNQVVDQCEENYAGNHTVKGECETGPMALVKDGTNWRLYRNIYCAVCNNANLSDLNCEQIPGR